MEKVGPALGPRLKILHPRAKKGGGGLDPRTPWIRYCNTRLQLLRKLKHTDKRDWEISYVKKGRGECSVKIPQGPLK